MNLYALWSLLSTNTSLTLNANGNSFQFGKTVNINATVTGSDGYITFFANNKKLFRCVNIPTSSLAATCVWKVNIHGQVAISATFSPTASGYLSSTSASTYSNTIKRSVSR
jgi:hypothetical protein